MHTVRGLYAKGTIRLDVELDIADDTWVAVAVTAEEDNHLYGQEKPSPNDLGCTDGDSPPQPSAEGAHTPESQDASAMEVLAGSVSSRHDGAVNHDYYVTRHNP